MTTTYIDSLFEQVYDSATGNLTYRHYILAGGARVGVETIDANSGGTVTSDTLSFYVRDEVGSVVATVTEGLGGVNQSMALASYGAWGKARATSGSTAYQDPAPGTFYSPTPTGQEEGFAGHDNLSDTGLVDMEGRVYDPEVGTFLSPDPNVQYPFSSQGYERYSYVGDNPLSLSDPSGYFSLSEAGIGQLISEAGPFLNAVPGCAYWCTAAAEAVGGYMQSGNNLGAGLEAGVLSFGESYAFTYVGDEVSWGSGATGLFEKSFTEGIIGGAFSEAGGGNFGDGFTGAFVSSQLSPVIGGIGGNPNVNPAVYFSASNMAARAVVSAIVGGTVAEVSGGNFGDAAFAAAMQRMFNDEKSRLWAEEVAYGEFRNYAVTSNGSSPGGLADAEASAAAACARNGGGCNYVNGSHASGLDKQAWDNIVAAIGGRDESGGGNYMCVNTTACTVVTKAYTFENGQKILVVRPVPLTPSGVVTVLNTGAGTLTLYFYRDPYHDWLTRQDFLFGPNGRP